jgi:thiol-disulfide isomerase/thioredoxin
MERSRPGVHVLLAALASGLLLAGCGGKGGDGGGPVQADLPMAPDFSFEAYQGEKELGGRELRLSDVVALGKPIILNFWAAQCPPCQVEMPEFQEYYDKHRKQVLMLGVDVGAMQNLGLPQHALSLLHTLKITYPAVTTADEHVGSAYQILGLPATYFINSAGQIAHTWTGLLTKEKLEELAGALIDAEK